MRRKFICFCALLAMLASLSALLWCLHALGYRVNRSASLPGYVYRLTPLDMGEKLVHGDCVAVDLSRFENHVIRQGVERGYVNFREPMLKRIGAVPGDRVAIAGNELFINDIAVPVTVASADSYGGVLLPWPTPLVLPPDHYWLVSDSQRGFDSRYFGPINRTSFTHRARFIF